MKTHIARKKHQCTECLQTIPAGHRYFRVHKEVGEPDSKEHTNRELYKGAEFRWTEK